MSARRTLHLNTNIDPYNLARRFASLDHLSGGRVAWNAVTTYDADAAANFSLSAPLDKAARYARAAEFVEAPLSRLTPDGALHNSCPPENRP